MSGIKVSVVIPIYNAERFLPSTIPSVINQTLKEIEIICVNDGSTDNSLNLLYEYQRKDLRIKVIDQKNAGAGVARNHGMRYASGKYIIFLDSDDIFEANMLERMYLECEMNTLDVVICRSDGFVDNLAVREHREWCIRRDLLPDKEIFNPSDIKKDFFVMCVWWSWDKMFRRDFIVDNGLVYQNLRSTDDLYFVVCNVLLAQRIKCIEEVLVHQRIFNANSISSTRENSWDCFLIAMDSLQEFLKDRGIYERFKADYINYAISFSLWHIETMRGVASKELFYRLKESWYLKLGIDKLSPQEFYYSYDYERLHVILDNDFEDYLLNRLSIEMRENTNKQINILKINGKVDNLETDLRGQKEQSHKKQELINDLIRRNTDLIRRNTDLIRRNTDLESQLINITTELNAVKTNLKDIKNGCSFKIGRILTYIPRKFFGKG